jgi:hypothetical protein
MKAEEAVERIDAACSELLRVHDLIKHGSGIQAEFPWPHNADPVEAVKHLEDAEYHGRNAARLLSKLTKPKSRTVEE